MSEKNLEPRPSTKDTVRRALALFSDRRGSVAVVVGTLALPVLSGGAVDCVVGVGQVDFAGLYRALSWIAATLGATAICQWALTAVTNRLAFGAALTLRKRAFDHLQELPLSYIDSHGHGDLAARIVTDADMLTNGLLMAFQQLPVGVLTVVVTLVFMFALNPAIAAVVALLTPISIFTARFIAAHSAKHFSGQTRLRGELTAYVEEMVGGISAIETFDMADAVHERFAETDAALGAESFKAVFFSSLVNPTTRFANALVYAAIGIFGAFVAMGGGITVGGLSAFLGYADQYAKPFNDISGVATELQNSVACARRLFALLDVPAEKPDAPDAVVLAEPRGLWLRGAPPGPHRRRPTRPPGSAHCARGRDGLRQDHPHQPHHALLRRGRGRRARGRPRCARAHAQEPARRLGHGAAGHLGAPRHGAREREYGASRRHARGGARRLPRGLRRRLHHAPAAGLRHGARRLRLALCGPAAAFVHRTRHAGAPGDADPRRGHVQLLVQRALARLMEGRTSFVVAHRLSTVRDADLICVVADGVIAERGTHDELLAADGRYKRIYEAQFAPTE